MEEQVPGQLSIYDVLSDEDKGTVEEKLSPLDEELKYFFPVLTIAGFSALALCSLYLITFVVLFK